MPNLGANRDRANQIARRQREVNAEARVAAGLPPTPTVPDYRNLPTLDRKGKPRELPKPDPRYDQSALSLDRDLDREIAEIEYQIRAIEFERSQTRARLTKALERATRGLQ